MHYDPIPLETDEVDGFTIRAAATLDEDTDLSVYGKFQSKRCCRDCIDRKKAGTWTRGTFEFFHPEWPTSSHAEKRANWRVAEELASGVRCMYVVRVTASLNGVDLADEYLGGVDDTYLQGAALEMIPEAVRNAKTVLAGLVHSAEFEMKGNES